MADVVTPRATPGDSTWFTEARFGMFIHWGLYAMGARHEWQNQVEATSPDEYAARYFTRFDPDLYDPVAWADAAADAGMQYMVAVTKHQEGFCLFDSALTDFKATNAPAGRDLIRPLLDAFRERGLRTGVYYALPDWHHPDFTVDFLHPLASHGDWAELNAGRDMDRYREYMKGQIRELLTQYGPVDIFWPDFSYDAEGFMTLATNAELMLPRPAGPETDLRSTGKGAADWDGKALLEMVRELCPGILVNDRLGLQDGWDIKTPEQTVPEQWPTVHGEPALWETCQTFSGRWGYDRDGAGWKSVEQLVAMLADVVGKGGNLLLNVGPTARGEFDERVLDRLRGIGEWMRRHSRSIHGCTQAPADILALLPRGVQATYNPTTNRLYLHVLHWPAQPLVVPGIGERVEYAQLLHDASELGPPTDNLSRLHAPDKDALWLDLPRERPKVALPVIELFLRS